MFVGVVRGSKNRACSQCGSNKRCRSEEFFHKNQSLSKTLKCFYKKQLSNRLVMYRKLRLVTITQRILERLT